ncbi:MAG: hypothetical protein BMS9Abin17_0382 [Acidimicrobiia bacterium]|nr:MAG: hypothetical protein BMS9Abin17_0382 [Acidimicrobiia bacterium]
MRIVTFLALVVRRVWVKKGILFGSFLGATLVIALLVVVPLYEASVQAIDLKFSIDNALADEVDITAFSTQNDYDSFVGETNRDQVAESQQTWLLPWYPNNIERSQTREFSIIRSGPEQAIDFFALADAWRSQVETFVAEGSQGDPPPQPPFPFPPPEAQQVRIFTSPDLESRLTFLVGSYTTQTRVSQESLDAIPIMIGSRVAELMDAGPGDSFFLRPFSGLPSVFEWVQVAAVVSAADASDPIWGIDDPEMMVYWDQAVFDDSLAATSIDPQADPWLRETRGLPNTDVTQRWRLGLEPSTLELVHLGEFESRIAQFRAEVARDSGGTIPTLTPIIGVIDAFTLRSVVVGGPILAMLALVVGGAVYFLVYTSALTVEREGPEIALLKSRGASSTQTVGIHVGQSLLIATIATLLAPFVARFLVGLTGRIPPLSTLTGGDPLDVAQVRSVAPFMIAGGLITFVSMGVAVVPYATRGVLALRSLATRPATKSVWQKYNIDLFAIALSLVLLMQLRLRGFINLATGEATLDPLAVIFPALLLFTGALILLRIFPYVLKFVGWLFTKPRSMSMALTGWHLGRNPVPYGRLALLVWVTTGLGAFALTYAATLETSYADRAAFAAGADVRIVGAGAAYSVVPEGSLGTPVLRTDGAPRQSSRRAEVLEVRPDDFSRVVTWRSDYGAETPQELFSLLRPGGEAPAVGVSIPPGATSIEVNAVVIPQTLRAEQEDPYPFDTSVRLLARIIDNRTRVWTMAADVDFVDTNWTLATLDVTSGKNTNFGDPPEPPLVISSMWIERTGSSGPFVVDSDVLLFTEIVARGDGVDETLDVSGLSAINSLRIDTDASADEAATTRFSSVPAGSETPDALDVQNSPLWNTGPATKWSLPATRTRANTAVPQARFELDDIKVLLDREAAAIAGLQPGSVSSYSIGAQILDGEVVGFIENLPTATDTRRAGVMVVDLDAINAWSNGGATWSLSGPLSKAEEPQELWVRTDNPDTVTRSVLAQMVDEPEQLWTIGLAEAAFSSRPVQVGLVAILFVGAATGVVLALAGVTGYVLLAVARRTREMGVLRALGFERTSVGITFALEQFVVIGLGAAIGVVGGISLVVVMLPFLQLGETADVINPSILLSIPGVQLAGFIAIVGVLLIASVLWATRRVSVRRMSEVLREVER